MEFLLAYADEPTESTNTDTKGKSESNAVVSGSQKKVMKNSSIKVNIAPDVKTIKVLISFIILLYN